MLSYVQAIVIALVQGVTELFPVSSLGHSVLVPAWLGGSWETLVTQSSQAHSESSFYLAFIVALHVATALALLWFFRADWIRIIAGFFRSSARSLRAREVQIEGSDERLAWLIVIATIPVGITGLLFEHLFRTALAKPVAASAFLLVNGLILLAGDHVARRQPEHDHSRSRRPMRPRRWRSRPPPAAPRRTSLRPTPRTCASRESLMPMACSSAPSRSQPSSPGSVAPASPWWEASGAACPTRTRPGSRSFWRLQ